MFSSGETQRDLRYWVNETISKMMTYKYTVCNDPSYDYKCSYDDCSRREFDHTMIDDLYWCVLCDSWRHDCESAPTKGFLFTTLKNLLTRDGLCPSCISDMRLGVILSVIFFFF